MRAIAWLGAFALALGAGCTDTASSEPGLDAVLQVEGGQFRPGAFPADEGGPAAVQIIALSSQVVIDQRMGSARAVLASGARAAVVGIEGHDGAWIVPAQNPDIDTPGQPNARFRFGVTRELPPGPFVLRVAAADEDGRFGVPTEAMLVAGEEAPPTGELVIGLVWPGPADLDLHVVDPLGGEAWSDKPNTLTTPPGTLPGPDEWMQHGRLTRDANKDCVQHARPSEHVRWTVPPPSGEYIARVDTVSMCGAASTPWYVEVYRNGELVDAARGTSTPGDVLHGIDDIGLGRAGAGVTALRFSL